MLDIKPAKDVALENVENFHNFINKVVENDKEIIKELEEDGWKIEFHSAFAHMYSIRNDEPDTTICVAQKKVGEDKTIEFKKTATVAPGDVRIKQLGTHLALGRMYSAIKGA